MDKPVADAAQHPRSVPWQSVMSSRADAWARIGQGSRKGIRSPRSWKEQLESRGRQGSATFRKTQLEKAWGRGAAEARRQCWESDALGAGHCDRCWAGPVLERPPLPLASILTFHSPVPQSHVGGRREDKNPDAQQAILCTQSALESAGKYTRGSRSGGMGGS